MTSSKIKRGDRGSVVNSMQTHLNSLGYSCGKPDGIFGSGTEKAVKQFQTDQFVTGVIDSNTSFHILRELKVADMGYKLPPLSWRASPNFSSRGGARVGLVVIHFTASGTLEQACGWFENPTANASAHYVLGTNGKLVHMVKDSDKAWHAGKSVWMGLEHCNRFSIGIEVVNWGELKRKNGQFFAWPGNYSRKYTGSHPVKMDGRYWAPYTEKQYRSLIPLCQSLVDKFKLTSGRLVGHVDIAPDRKVDPGPHFDWARLRSNLIFAS